MSKSLKVICRIRPPLHEENPINIESNTLTYRNQNFTFNTLYSDISSQAEIYDNEVENFTKDLFKGKNSCVILFGTSDSGKSYTLRGSEGKNRGVLVRCTERILSMIERERSHGRDLELRVSVTQFYNDSISDLMVFNSRDLSVVNSNIPRIENLTEHPIRRANDLFSHLHHALQVRKVLLKPDPKLKTRSHFAVFLILYEIQTNKEIASIAFADLAASENASNDQKVFKENCLSQDEKKNIAKTFNALSKVLTSDENVWRENSLILSLKKYIESQTLLCCNVTTNPALSKHTMAALKYVSRIKGIPIRDSEIPLIDEIKRIKQEIKDFHGDSQEPSLDWLSDKEIIINQIQQQLSSVSKDMASTYLGECESIKNELASLRNKLSDRSPGLPSRIHTNESSLHMRESPPIRPQSPHEATRECFTDRNYPNEIREENDILRSKLQNSQAQLNLHLKKMDEMSIQIKERDIKIANDSLKITELQRIVRDQEALISDQAERLIEGQVKSAELYAKVQEYALRLQQGNTKPPTNPHSRSSTPELADSRIKELEKQLLKEREIHNSQVSQLHALLEKEKQANEAYRYSPIPGENPNLTNTEWKIQLKEKKKAISELEKQVQNMQGTLNEISFKAGVEAKDRKKYEEENIALRNRVSELLGNNNGLEGKYDILRIRSEELENNWLGARQEAEMRKLKNKSLRNKLKEMQKLMDMEKEEILILKKEAEELRFSLSDLNEENEKLNQDNQIHEEEKRAIQLEVEHLNKILEETSQKLSKQENALGNMGTKQDLEFLEGEIKKKSKKIKQLKQANQELMEKINDSDGKLNSEKNGLIQERDNILAELEAYRNGQVHELSIVENQVNMIEQELIKLKEQNKVLLLREQEIMKELRSSEAAKMKYKDKCCELKEQLNDLESYVAETETHLKNLIEQQKKDLIGVKTNEDKNTAVTSRLRALEDIQNLIKAHKNQ